MYWSMALEMGSLMIMPALVMGIIIGIINLIMMIKDETGSASSVISHGATAFIWVIVFVFLSMNYTLVLSMIPSLQNGFFGNVIVIRLILGLISAIYVHVHSGLFKGARGAGMHETWLHSFGLGLLVAISPYIWPFLAPMLPTWMGGSS